LVLFKSLSLICWLSVTLLSALLHTSPVEVVGVGVGAKVAARVGSGVLVDAGRSLAITAAVGDGIGDSLAASVGVETSVGGKLVSVGFASWVKAITVKAATTAVSCILAELIVGDIVGAEPQAARITAMNKIIGSEYILFFIRINNEDNRNMPQ